MAIAAVQTQAPHKAICLITSDGRLLQVDDNQGHWRTGFPVELAAAFPGEPDNTGLRFTAIAAVQTQSPHKAICLITSDGRLLQVDDNQGHWRTGFPVELALA
jgi:predicted nucleic acid-binding protein